MWRSVLNAACPACQVKTLAERFLKRPFTGRLFGGDASSAPVESDPNAMKMIANAGDEDDDSPSSPSQVSRTRNDGTAPRS